MLFGATILGFLVLLVLLADRLGSRLWQGGDERAYYRCEECDLRYPSREMNDPAFRICPAGHAVVMEPRRGPGAGMVGVFACLGFLAVAIILMLTRIVPPG